MQVRNRTRRLKRLMVLILFVALTAWIAASNNIQLKIVIPNGHRVLEMLHVVSVGLFGIYKTVQLIVRQHADLRLHVHYCRLLATMSLLLWGGGLIVGQAVAATVGFGLLLFIHAVECSYELWFELKARLQKLFCSE